jgi:hypothetical protein
MSRKKKEKTPIKFVWNIKGVIYDDPPDWVKKYLGKIFSEALSGN